MTFEGKPAEKPKPAAAVALLIAPAATMLLVSLPAVSLTQGMWEKGFDPVSAFVIAPFWIGLVAAPGYVKAAVTAEEFQPAWVRLSVVFALVASLGGAAAAIPLVFPVPFALASAISASLLLRRLLATTPLTTHKKSLAGVKQGSWPWLTFGTAMCWILFWTAGLALEDHIQGPSGCWLTSLGTARALFRNRSVRITGAAMRGATVGITTHGVARLLFLEMCGSGAQLASVGHGAPAVACNQPGKGIRGDGRNPGA